MKKYDLITVDSADGMSVKTLNLIEKIENMYVPLSELEAIRRAVEYRIALEHRKAELTPGYDPETGKVRK